MSFRSFAALGALKVMTIMHVWCFLEHMIFGKTHCFDRFIPARLLSGSCAVFSAGAAHPPNTNNGYRRVDGTIAIASDRKARW